MNDCYKQFYNKHLWRFLLYAVVAITLIAPLGSNQFSPNIPDLFNHLMLISKAKTSLMQGGLPLRTFLNGNNGDFYPFYQFYSPTTFTFAGILQFFLPGNNPYTTYKCMLFLSIISSGYYMQAATFKLIPSKNIAMICSVIFITAPYLILVINQLAGFCETLGIYFIPVVLYYNLIQFYEGSSLKTITFSAIAWYVLITVHLITFLYTAIFIATLFILFTILNRHSIKALLGLAISGLIALLAACWFLAPVIILGNAFYIAGSFNDLKSFSGFFPPLISLLSFNANYINAGKEHVRLMMYPSLGWPIVGGILCSLLAICSHKIPNSMMKKNVLALLILASITLFLICSPINVWGYLPHFLMICQYSWRLLGQTAWLGALLAGHALYCLLDISLTNVQVAFVAFVILASGSTWLTCSTTEVNSVHAFMQNPTLVFNSNSYILDLTKHPEYIDRFENILLPELNKNGHLVINKPYTMHHRALLHLESFKLMLKAHLNTPIPLTSELVLMVDKKIISTKALSQTELKADWVIPLTNLSNTHTIEFKVRSHEQFITVPVENIILDQLLITEINPQEKAAILTAKNCYAFNHTTYCQYYADKKTSILELPIYYYPSMWSIHNGNHSISYFCNSNAMQPKLAVKVTSGQMHHLKAKFIGLKWANNISLFTWIVLSCSLLFLLMTSLIKQKKHAHTLE